MKSKLHHVYIYVDDKDKFYDFYKPVLEYLGYKEFIKEDWGFGFGNERDEVGIIFEQTEDKYIKRGYHRKRMGLNHLAFKVQSKEDVDKFYNDVIKPRNIKTLYNSPKRFPQYSDKFYAVFFEDPMRLKLEVVYS